MIRLCHSERSRGIYLESPQSDSAITMLTGHGFLGQINRTRLRKRNMIRSKIVLVSIIVAHASLNSLAQNVDEFAKIGTMKTATRLHLLEEKRPEPLPETYLSVTHEPGSVFKPFQLMDTQEELNAAFAKMRAQFLPFMEDHAPAITHTRTQIKLDEFLWRVETQDDIRDFTNVIAGKGDWETVRIPHFGPPLGRAVTYYYKKIMLSDDMFKKGSLFVCFKGVDYKAHVFMNGSFIGSHEGFFAPFEFNVTPVAKVGENTLVVKVENDYTTHGGRDDKGNHVIGNKIYAAAGPGYDDPEEGWHHCPAGMGIYQGCSIESRNALHIHDMFVRPLPDSEEAEVWLEVNSFHEDLQDLKLAFSLYGQNFSETVFEDLEYVPSTTHIPGIGDLAKPTDWQQTRLKAGWGVNHFKIKIPIKNPRQWCNDTPWLYQLQIKLYDSTGQVTDETATQFGMRSFTMDTVSSPKGMMSLNGQTVRLRGANTMGYMQQDVMKADWDQLIDDILLAKVCHMNFLRLTQRPVQAEIYAYCDQLGLMLQTDLPLFGSLRPNQFLEGVKQANEMERFVRNHPSNIMVTYINERFPNAEGKPHRNMATSEEYEKFFKACDQAVLFANPDRVIKAGDGDYDPPSPGLPDNHCYNAWYNGHGLGLGEMHKGYWQPVKPDWYYACGEFGAEGLDPVNTMLKHYPQDWLPKNQDPQGQWTPLSIPRAQTQAFHTMWFNTQNTLEDWVDASQAHQAWAIRLQTEAMRRDNHMVSFAVHLFIDAWPAGWMKTIMDVDRQPKKAFFVYRDALNPLLATLRTDRTHFVSGETINIEAWLSNDLNTLPKGYTLSYQLEKEDRILLAHSVKPQFQQNGSVFQGYLSFDAPAVRQRTGYQLRLGLLDDKGREVSQSVIDIDVFPRLRVKEPVKISVSGTQDRGGRLLAELDIIPIHDVKQSDVIIIDNYNWYAKNTELVDNLVQAGKTALFLELPEGRYTIGGSDVHSFDTVMGHYYFVSPETGHALVQWAEPMDFKFWFNEQADVVTPFIGNVLKAEGWTPILTTGQTSWGSRDEGPYLAVAERKSGKGAYVICQLQLNHRINSNPCAKKLLYKLLGLETNPER